MGLGVAAMLALTVYSLLSLARGVELRGFEQHLNDKSTDSLDTLLLAQSFRSDRANLDRVDLQAATYSGLPAAGKFSLVKGDGPEGEVVFSDKLSNASFANNPYVEFRFPPVAASAGETYTLVLTSESVPINRSYGFSYSSFDTLSSGHLYTDAGTQRGDLVISAYYRYGPSEWLGDALGTLTSGLLPALVWVLLLILPGGALLVWLPSRLSGEQRLLAAPGVTLLALPVFFLLVRAVGIHMGDVGMWLLLVACAVAIGVRVVLDRKVPRMTGLSGANAAFWALMALVLIATLAVRMMSLRDLPAGMGLDAYHHTLIAQMFILDGGIPQNYLPFAPLASFTYHFGFHDMIASAAWLLGQNSPLDTMILMPQAGQIATTLPVLTLTVFVWKATGNRWAGLLAGASAGLLSLFPAYYVNWSRYTQGLGLALLPVAILLYLEVVQRPLRPARVMGDSGATGPVSWQFALRQSGPYLLGVIGAAGLFLTHYRIAIVYAAFVALYMVGRLLVEIRERATLRELVAPVRRSAVLALLAVGALSPWLVNLAQNFRSHLVGRNTEAARDYYDLGSLWGLLTDWRMLVLLVLAGLGLIFAWRARKWVLVLAALVWVPLAVWSNPYGLDGMLPGFRLPYAGYLDVTTVAQSVWLPLAMLAGYALAEIGSWFLSLGQAWSAPRQRLWELPVGVLMGVAVLAVGLAAAQPVAANIDKKVYIASGDEQALVWMRDNLPRNAYVLVNPFAFGWAPGNVYGSDSGMWAPLVAGVRASVPPLPAYNERLGDPDYTNKLLDVIKYEPFMCNDPDPQRCVPPDWQALRDAGVTHIFVGTRGGNGGLSVSELLQSEHTQLLYHVDGAYVFELTR
jgi:hypothetical protein